MSTIQKTKDYNQFKYFESNRDINCQALIESIKKKDLLFAHPILVTPDLYVIDGQHRLESAKYLHLPIYYIIDKQLDENCIPICQVQRGWTIYNFINFYRRKNEDYQFVYNMVEKHKLPEYFILDCVSTIRGVYASVRAGKLKINGDKNIFDKLFAMYTEVEAKCKEVTLKKKITNDMRRALFNIIKKEQYNHKKFMEKIDSCRQSIVDAFKYRECGTIEEYILKNAYNSRTKQEENRLA